MGQPVASRIARTQIGQIIHDVLVVPETKVLAELLAEFKERRRHLAVVVDEIGSTAGVITVETLEQLAATLRMNSTSPFPNSAGGRIRPSAGRLGKHSRPGDAARVDSAPRRRLRNLGGFVLARLQRIPFLGESFEYEGYRYTVEEMEGHRIAKVKIEKVENADTKADGAKQSGD